MTIWSRAFWHPVDIGWPVCKHLSGQWLTELLLHSLRSHMSFCIQINARLFFFQHHYKVTFTFFFVENCFVPAKSKQLRGKLSQLKWTFEWWVKWTWHTFMHTQELHVSPFNSSSIMHHWTLPLGHWWFWPLSLSLSLSIIRSMSLSWPDRPFLLQGKVRTLLFSSLNH